MNYKDAQDKALKLFNKLDLNVSISEPQAHVKEGWPCIKYVVSFTKRHCTIQFDYFLGIGHVKYIYSELPWNNFGFSRQYQMSNIYHLMKEKKPIKEGFEKEQSEIAALIAKKQGVKPEPFEVLAYVCRDALEAIQTDFKTWAENFGYNDDSIKAMGIYNLCRDQYTEVLRILTTSQIEKLSELASQF